MQIRGYLHRYRLSSSGKKNRMLQGTCMPSYSPVLKNAGYGLLLTLLWWRKVPKSETNFWKQCIITEQRNTPMALNPYP